MPGCPLLLCYRPWTQAGQAIAGYVSSDIIPLSGDGPGLAPRWQDPGIAGWHHVYIGAAGASQCHRVSPPRGLRELLT